MRIRNTQSHKTTLSRTNGMGNTKVHKHTQKYKKKSVEHLDSKRNRVELWKREKERVTQMNEDISLIRNSDTYDDRRSIWRKTQIIQKKNMNTERLHLFLYRIVCVCVYIILVVGRGFSLLHF